jgi:putative ABC transport system permease protein
MNWFKQLFSRRRLFNDLSEEIQEHLEEKIEELVASGMPRTEATAAARREFGNVTLVQEDSRQVWRWPSIEDFFMDVRYSLRGLGRDRRLALAAIFALSLGIGAMTVIFGVVHGLLLDPFPYKDSRRLVSLTVENLTKSQGITHRDFYFPQEFLALRQQNRVFEDIVGYDSSSFFYDDGKGTRQLVGAFVTTNTFEFYGVPPLLGRGITPDDGQPAAAPVFVMNYKMWQKEFDGDPKILGATFVINDEPRTLVGIMPSRFDIYNVSIWLPRSPNATGSLTPVGRLKPGVPLRAAAADLEVIVHYFLPDEPRPTVSVQTLIDGALGDFKKMLYALLMAVLMLLLIACSNVANLLLARATARRGEIAIRTALGASRIRLMRQLLVESLLLSMAACVAGCAFAYFGLIGVAAIIPPDKIPREAVIGLNIPVLVFAMGIAMLTTLLCGVAPAFHAVGGNLQRSLAGSANGRGGGFRHGKFRAGLVIVEVALSIILLIGGGLMMRSLFALAYVDLPFNPTKILYVRLSFPRKIYYTSPDKKPDFFKKVLPRIKALPGVISDAETWQLPPNAWLQGTDVTIMGRPDAKLQAHLELCTEGYFQTLGLPSLRGKLLAQSDVDSARPVAVVNQTLARQFFGNQDPIGQKIKFQVFDRTFLDAPHNTYFDIIGVVPDFRRRPGGTRYSVVPEAFVPGSVAGFGNPLSIVARTAGDPHSLLRNVYQEIWAVDPHVTFTASGSIKDLLSDENQVPVFDSIALSSFAGIGLLLVVIGIFSVMTYTVSLQTSEIGIRMALGAQQSAILGMVLRKGMLLIVAGTLIGLFASFGLTRYLASQLWGTSATDPSTFATVVTLVILVGLAACLLPARRATRVDPMLALRYE